MDYKIKNIKNKVYSLSLYIYKDCLYVYSVEIKSKYRGRKYMYRIFDKLIKTYNRTIFLECHPTIVELYKKLNFVKIGDTFDGYYEMRRDVKCQNN